MPTSAWLPFPRHRPYGSCAMAVWQIYGFRCRDWGRRSTASKLGSRLKSTLVRASICLNQNLVSPKSYGARDRLQRAHAGSSASVTLSLGTCGCLCSCEMARSKEQIAASNPLGGEGPHNNLLKRRLAAWFDFPHDGGLPKDGSSFSSCCRQRLGPLEIPCPCTISSPHAGSSLPGELCAPSSRHTRCRCRKHRHARGTTA